MKVKLLAFAIVAVFGAIRLPLEEKLSEQRRAAFFHGAKLDLEMRQRLGQLGFVAALGGFRAIIADLLWIQGHSAWERTEWGRMARIFDTVTSLQPRALLFWDGAAWHMAYNASVAAREDPKQPREALRIRAEREYWRLGEDLLLRGTQNNPDRALLFDRLGMLYRDKFKDPEKAHAAYERGRQLPDALPYVRRFAAYELAKIPGREQDAYDRLKALYSEGEDERMPTLLRLLSELEEKLGVPENARVYTPPPPSPR